MVCRLPQRLLDSYRFVFLLAKIVKKSPVKQRRLGDEAALNYVQSRAKYTRTEAEENIVREWLRLLPEGSVVLDCPCGTGRFVRPILELGFR